MNKRAREFIVKLFSLILAITMSIPTNVFASSGTKRPKEMPTVIRLADSGGGGDTYIEDTTEDTYIEDGEEFYTEDTVESTPQETTEVIEEAPQEEAYTIAEEDARNYILSQKARLNDNHDGIIYDIKVAKKEKSYHDPAKNLSLSLMLNPNQALKDIKLTKVVIDGKEEKRDDKSNKLDELQTLNLTTPTFENEITYTVEASIDKKAIDANKLYSMDLSLDIGQFNLDLQRISYKFVEYEKEDKTKELKLTHIKEAEDALRSISYKKDDGDVDKVIYTDYIISKDKGDEESRVNEKNKIQYGLNLENLKKEDTEISLDYYKADDKGFNMEKEFSAKIPCQDKLDLDIPASYILKLTVTSKADKKNTKIESHKINGREVKSPRFVKEEEKSSEDDEEAAKKAEAEKKAAEEKAKEEETRKAEEAKKAEEEKQAEEANKAEEEAKSAEEKREAQEKAKSEQEAKEAKEQEASDKLKAEKEASNKEARKKDDLLNSLKEESPTKEEENKAKTEVKEDSNLSKADAELKAALADKTKGIEDIQNLLTSIGEKYKLTREDQAKLMTANDAAIKALVEKDRKENFRPNNLRQDPRRAPSEGFDYKLFNLYLEMNVKASPENPIPEGWYFDVDLGPNLTGDNQVLKDLYYGNVRIATPTYNKDSHTIRYKFIREITNDTTLTVDQNLGFDTNNIGNKDSVDINIKVAPKNNPVQSMDTITVKKDASSPVESKYVVKEIEGKQVGSYPYQLSYKTDPAVIKDSNNTEITNNKVENGSYVEWNIEVETSTLKDEKLKFNKLNLTVFGSNKQGLKNFEFKAATNEADLDDDGGYRSSAATNELLFQDTSINKEDLGDKIYIRVRGYIDPSHVHSDYSIGLRINPDNNYVANMLNEIQDKFNSLPTPLKWLEGVEDAKRFADIPFNLVETMIPARVNLRDNFTNEGFYYDHTRTIVATRESDTRVDWHALDLLRIDETEDPALSNPDFLLNGSYEKNPKSIDKYYYVPLQNGGYRRTGNINEVLRDDGKYYPGTIVAYEYKNQNGEADDVYNLIASIKEKKINNLDPSYTAPTEGGIANLFIERISTNELKDKYVAYIEHPYNVMRINKNFDMVQCFNSGIQDPTYKGNNGVFLDIHEDVSGDYLISRLNETIGKPTNDKHSLVDILNGKLYDGVNFNPEKKPKGEVMEDLMKRVYFYGEEVKKKYANDDYFDIPNPDKKEMHRMIETSMYQRVVHHLTDGKDLGEDYFKAPSDYNVKEWKVPYTLTGERERYPKQGYKDQYTGGENPQPGRYLSEPDTLRKLRDNENQIKDSPPVQKTQYDLATELWELVKKSYGEGSDWSKEKADSVQLVFYSHTESKKYQELITGRVTEPIQIDKYDEFGNKLEKADFSFYNIYTGEEVTWTSSKDDNDHKLYLKPGTYRVRETNPPTGYQKLKDFTIEVTREEINGDKGPYGFVGLPEIRVNDGYKTNIILRDVPVSATGREMVEIDKNNNIKVKVINIQDNLGKIRFTKKNKFTKLNGAEFTLRKIKVDLKEEDTEEEALQKARAQVDNPTYDEKAYKQVSTGSYGIFQFDQIPTGYYVLEETKTPAGYKKSDNKLIVATAGKDDQGKATIDVKFDDKDVYVNDETVIVNEPKDTEIKFRKIRKEYLNDKDTEHLGLANAKFRLESIWTVDGSTYSKEVFSNQPEKSEDDKKVDDENIVGGGCFSFKNIPIGEYKLIELQAPNGYQKTDLAYWKLVVKENKEEGHVGEVIYELYEVSKNTDQNSHNLTKVDLDQVLYKGEKTSAFQIGNEPRKIDTQFIKKLGVIKKNEDGSIVKGEDGKPVIDKTIYDKTKLKGKDGNPVSFNLYKADYYGAILKDKDGKPILAQENITQGADGKFHLQGLEFGGYYVLREMNPPDGYTNANDILLKVEAEAIANEGEMRVIVRDPNTNTEFGEHATFEGVVDFKEGEQLGEFSIKKTGRAIDYYKDGKLVKVDENNPIDVGLRRAYFRLYTADNNFEIIKEGNFAKEYIQKVTPGEPIITYKKNPDGSFKLDENGNKIRIGVDPSSLPKNQGIVTFDNLTPGYYVLEEYRGPAGYEKTTDKWYVKVLDNGRVIRSSDKNDPAFTDTSFRARRLVEITDLNAGEVSAESLRNNILKAPKPVPADARLEDSNTINIGDENIPQRVSSSGWQDVDPSRSDVEKIYNNQTNGRVESRIIAINKDDGSKAYKQQILITPNKKIKQWLELARVNGANTDDVIISSVKEVGTGSTLDNIVGNPTDIKYNRGRLGDSFNVYKPRISTNTDTDKPILIEVEVPYSKDERIGLRVDYYLDGLGSGKKASSYESGYDNEDAINKELTYSVSFAQMTNGSVRADKDENIKTGDVVNLTVTPNSGYKLKTLLVNGEDKTSAVKDNKYQFTMPEKDVNVNAIFEEDTPQPPDPEEPSGDVRLKVKFVYSNSKEGEIDNDIPTSPKYPGKISLQVEKNGAYETIKEVDAPYAGNLDFDKLDSSKNYRLVYNRDSKKAEDWSLPVTSIYNIESKDINKDTKTIKLTIQNGNTMEIFNIDETGFRIPLRVTKVNENKGLLTGSRFRARKLVNGEPTPIYEDGKPTGESEYPKYHSEEFDATSEATGLPGDNYFRELTPGIYELWEVQPPNGSYRLPTDENGNPIKWYFKVKINEGKKPSDDDYMDIDFNFEYKFKDKNDSSWNGKVPESDREKLQGKTIHGLEHTDVDGKKVFDPYTEVVPDDHRSDPARPDAPYKGINDVWVTNYMTTTDLKFMKKDAETQKNLENAVFTLKKALVDKEGNVEFDANGKAKVDPQTGVEEAKKVKPEPYNKEKGYAEATASKISGVHFTNIQAGTYILEEIKPADGYELNDDSFITIKFIPGEDGSWTQEVKGYKKEDANGKYQEIPATDTSLFVKASDGYLESVENKQLYTKLSFEKINAGENTKLYGTSFRLTKVDKDGKRIENDGYNREIAGFGSANYNFSELTVGRYRLEETTTIEGFAKPDPWYFNVVQDPKTLKLKIEFENKDNSIEYNTDTEGNLQDVKVNNYPKIPLRFKKVTGEDKPLKDAYFTLKKVRESMDENSMSFTYNQYGNLETLVKDNKTYKFDENGDLDTIDGVKVTENDKVDGVSGATKKYFKDNIRSQEDGEVYFGDLDEGIYELIETQVPDGYEDSTQQVRWIVEVKKGENGLEVIYNKETEDTYYKNYDSKYYDETYKKNNFKTNNNFAKLTNDPDKFEYKLINKKNTINLRWKKHSGDDTTNLIEKDTRFILIKVIPDSKPDEEGKVADPMDENIATSGVSYGGSRNIAASTNGIFEVKDLSKGIYVLYETKAPEGYELMDRQIVIKVYEDEDENHNYTLKKKFFEMTKDENGKNTLVEKSELAYLFNETNDKEPFIDDKGYFYVKNSEKASFILSKGFMTELNGKKDFNFIENGELELSLYKDPKDDKNTDTNVYSHTINLGKDKYYKFPLGKIQYNVKYLLEETKAPAGYVKSKNKYRLEFRKPGTEVIPYLVGVVKADGKDLTDKEGNLITDTGSKIPTGGLKIEAVTTEFGKDSESSFKIVNNKTEVEFKKVGKDKVEEDGKLVDKETPLKDVKFYLEKQDQDRNYYPVTEDLEFIKKDDKGYYIEKANGEKVYGDAQNPVSIDNAYTFTSNKEGKFKIENLNDGFYQLMEPEAAKDANGEAYMKVQGAVKKFRILEGEVYIEDNKSEKKLDETNKEKLTKITNLKPGKGEFELNKTDEDGKNLDGVTFELYDSEGTKITEQTTKDGGKINFTGLPFGYYWIKEKQTQEGFVLDTKKKLIALGGGDWKVPDKMKNDVSKAITFDGVQAGLVSTADKPNNTTVYPNKAEGIFAKYKFKIDDNTTIEPGDYFTIHFSDNVDLDGINKDNDDKGKKNDNLFDIIGPAGLLAKAKVNDDRKSITYTFTDYVQGYDPESMSMYLQLFPNRRKVDHKQDITVTADIGDNTDQTNNNYHYSDSIEIDYRGYNDKLKYNGYQNPTSDISSYMLRLDPKDKTFTAIVYYNPWNKILTNKNISFTADEDIDVSTLSVNTYRKSGWGSHRDGYVDDRNGRDLPDSYDVDFNRGDLTHISNLYRYKIIFDRYGQNTGKTRKIIIPSDNLNQDNYASNTYVIEIKGKLVGDNVTSLKTSVEYKNHNVFTEDWYGNYQYENTYTGNFETWSQFFLPGGLGDVSKQINLVNYKNKIEFVKVDGGVIANAVDQSAENEDSLKGIGEALKGAKFKLQVKNGSDWIDSEYGERTSDENGIFSWEGLKEGSYQVKEIQTPDDKIYDLPTKTLASFDVDKNGNIVNIKPEHYILENHKKAEIKIRKTDQDGNSLKGAVFVLAPEDKDSEYDAKTRSTGEDGIVTFDKLISGKYTLTEEKAPDGYKKTDREYYLEVTKDGKVLWTNSFYDSYNNMKQVDVKTYTGQDQENLRSEIVGIDKENKKFRQIVTITAKSSELEKARLILESKAKGIKLSQANTEVRVVQYDGSDIKDKDGSTYTVNINNGDNPNLTLRINPPYRKKEENKSQGSDESTSPEENDGDIVRTYKVIVDMPYGDDEKLGAKVNYDIGKISETTGKVEFTRNDEVKEVDKYAEKKNYFAHRDHTSPLNYKAQYLPRDINLITTDIANIKQPDIYLKKVDADDKTALAGAEFELQKKVGDVYKSISNKGKVIDSPTDNTPKWTETSDGQGHFEFKSIPDGEYRIVETKAPTGYSLSEKTVYKFKVNKGKIYKVDKDTGKAESTELVVGTDKKPNSETNRIEITNKKAQYPYTGGPGTWIGFTILGALTMIAAGIYLAQKKQYQTK